MFKLVARSTSSITARSASTQRLALVQSVCSVRNINTSHRKPNQDAEEAKEQKLFDKNKKRLDKMEHDKTYQEVKQPDCDVLRKRGDDARIEQNRPDDGNY
ncbi:hypothetical protein NCAS_0B04260 [Naumovozyma castellii]|uniref:Uncharacterized protein n=1 Tax=Naumovozyma castellii TaxID=27288 RepID=G0VAI5_NAUCA|nr:hypothetical protein NCAS_0B04260 [Naumovozyma castellii CBS 4309]CCC68510.1 hypothetical protein NCAS_0B04260 [Naumovozyma castellii CBS 4309]